MNNYQSLKRFSSNNNTGMTADLLKEQLDSIELSQRPPQLPSAYDIFGSNEDSYQPSGFLPADNNNVSFINDIEYAGAHIAFREFVKALAKKLTSGTAKPDLAIAYGKYFAYLSKTITRAAKDLEAVNEKTKSYLKDKAKFDAINAIFQEQLKHEQNLSPESWQTIDLEEQQAKRNAQLEERNAELAEKLERVSTKQNKLSVLVQKFMKAGSK